MSDRTDRSERLRRRFDRPSSGADDDSSERTTTDATSTEPTKEETATTSEPTGETANADTRTSSVKERPSTLMYLPDDVHRDLDLTFDEVNLKYRRAFDEKLEKNRDYYPLVAVHGLQTLKGWDADEIDDALGEIR